MMYKMINFQSFITAEKGNEGKEGENKWNE